MKRGDLAAGSAVLLFSLWLLWESSRMPMFSGDTPGRGFLPFWLGVLVAALGVLLLVQGLARPAVRSRKIIWPSRGRLLRIGITVTSLAAYTFLITVAGYILSTFAFVWLLVRLLGSYRWYWSAGFGLATALSTYLVFQVLLGVPLPTGFLIIP